MGSQARERERERERESILLEGQFLRLTCDLTGGPDERLHGPVKPGRVQVAVRVSESRRSGQRVPRTSDRCESSCHTIWPALIPQRTVRKL